MSRRIVRLRKSVLSLALGACLSTLAIAPAFAQSAMGAVAGRANAGDQITLVNTATGATFGTGAATVTSWEVSAVTPRSSVTVRVIV